MPDSWDPEPESLRYLGGLQGRLPLSSRPNTPLYCEFQVGSARKCSNKLLSEGRFANYHRFGGAASQESLDHTFFPVGQAALLMLASCESSVGPFS